MGSVAEVPNWFLSYHDRLDSFKYWPFKKGSCSPEKMAEAGFYSIGGKSEPDQAKCYVCLKELDGWEIDDDPWSEHQKHSPQCAYVLLGKKPGDLTVHDVCSLQVERMKKSIWLDYEKKVKTLEELKEVVTDELKKYTNKGKGSRKKTSRAPSKRSSRRD